MNICLHVYICISWICACVYQGNAAAELKIGDYYYYGLGTAVNYRKAVAHYRAASEARNAQVYLVCVVCVNACMQDGFVRLCVRVSF